MWSAIVTSGPNLVPNSCCDCATSWWCFSPTTPISIMVESISARRSCSLSTGGTGK